MAAAQAGDRAALERLLRRHYDRLHALCRRMCGNQADADDATQEALMAIVRGLGRFDGRSAFTTWSYRVATNACLDELRRRARRPLPEADADDGDGAGDDRLRHGLTVGDTTEPVADQIDVDAALRRLPVELRAAVVLRDLCGLDYSGIAEALDIPGGTVRSRIARGRARLADLLAEGNRQPQPGRRTP